MHVEVRRDMHWLALQLDKLRSLAERHLELKGLAAARAVDPVAANEARHVFFEALSKTAAEIRDRPGVDACFVCHDGLVCETVGEAPSFEALAALAQACVEVARSGAASSALGDIRQMVLVGEDSKLALFCLGTIAVGIRCGPSINLARSLAA